MPEFRLTRLAKAEVAAIISRGLEGFGPSTSQSYVRGLYDLLQRLAQNPAIGRAVDGRITNAHRHPYRRHVIFYRAMPYGILVVRIAPMAKMQKLDEAP